MPTVVRGPGRSSARDVYPDTGLVRLSTARPAPLGDVHTALGGVPGTGWDLHGYRHSGLTHLGEARGTDHLGALRRVA